MNTKYYVTMTDTFMSGWGKAEGRINKLVITCDTLEQATLIERNAKLHSEMKSVRIATKPTHYSEKKYLVSERVYDDMRGSWKEEV